MGVRITEPGRAQDCFAYWREVLAREIFHCRPERFGEQPFRGEVRKRTIGALPFVEVRVAGHRVFRDRAEIARSPIPSYVVRVTIEGKPLYRVLGNAFGLSPGDACVIDALHEWDLVNDEPGRALNIKIPKDWIDARVTRPDSLHGKVLRCDDPLSRLMTAYVINGFQTAEHLTPGAASLFAHHTVELLAEALRGSLSHEPAPANARREALFVRACRMIAIRFAHSNLGVDQIARELGVSSRLLQKMFAERGKTVMRSIFEERVSRAATLLAAPEAAHRTITDVAFACGFNDSAHFTRAFVAQMKATLSAWRKNARAQDPPGHLRLQDEISRR